MRTRACVPVRAWLATQPHKHARTSAHKRDAGCPSTHRHDYGANAFSDLLHVTETAADGHGGRGIGPVASRPTPDLVRARGLAPAHLRGACCGLGYTTVSERPTRSEYEVRCEGPRGAHEVSGAHEASPQTNVRALHLSGACHRRQYWGAAGLGVYVGGEGARGGGKTGPRSRKWLGRGGVKRKRRQLAQQPSLCGLVPAPSHGRRGRGGSHNVILYKSVVFNQSTHCC